MSEPQDQVTDEETDARLDRLLHDLDVANDTHPAHHRPTGRLGALDRREEGERHGEGRPSSAPR